MKPKKILVIRLKQIGDALLSLPVCNSLRATYPDAQIDYLVYEHIAHILHNQTAISNIKTISPHERKNKLQYFKKVWSLRREEYDLVIDLINVPISAITTFVSGAPHTIGFDKKRARAKLYKTAVVHRDRGDTLTKKLDILQGLKDQAIVSRDWSIPVTESEQAAVKVIMQTHGVDFNRPVFFIAASSRRTDKLWPSNYMLETLNHVQRSYNAQIVFNWVPGMEAEFVAKLAAQLDKQEDVFANIDLTLRQLPVAISLCDFFFGNDGGPHHMAVGTQVPSLVVYAPFHLKEVWLPLNKPQHQGIDIKDALSIDHAEFRSLEKSIKADVPHYYHQIQPRLVIAKLDDMLSDLGLAKTE